MKILLNSYTGIGAWFSLRLLEEGHSVDYHLMNEKAYDEFKDVLKGIAPVPKKGQPKYEMYDLSIFDLTGNPAKAEQSLKETPTIGDGNLQSQLEDDRLFGVEIMEQCDINVPPYEVFNDIGEAKRYIKKSNKRYVFKPNGGQEQSTDTTYVSKNADDLLKFLDKLSTTAKGAEFILQEVVDGTEISTEAWFNGEDFYLINATLEEKKFMDGRVGPNTGCSGNLVWIYDQPPAIFNEGLYKLKDFLKEYQYRGMIDLNTIVSSTKIYGLEWTPRFGYDASATLFNLINSNLGEFIYAVTSGAVPEYEVNGQFGAAVRLSIPPYPSEIKGKHPIDIPIEGIEPEDVIKDIYVWDAKLGDKNELVTCGAYGCVAVPISSGLSISEAFFKVQDRIKRIQIPNMQYRTDIEKCVTERYKVLSSQGWLR